MLPHRRRTSSPRWIIAWLHVSNVRIFSSRLECLCRWTNQMGMACSGVTLTTFKVRPILVCSLLSNLTLCVEHSGKMVINKPSSFRAQIIPQATAVLPPSSPMLSPRSSPPVSPSTGCTLSLIQESGAKSTLEVVALRLRQEWRYVGPNLYI